MESVMVTVVCFTYNHQDYVRQALNSMLAQKTDFKYEILVHDDASTDATTNIIHEMCSNYPDIIHPIYQTENQYSKGVNIFSCFITPEVRGKYVAFCDGDDYWTDPFKLQKQVSYMEKHSLCTLCIHNAIRVNRNGKRIGTVNTTNKSRKISCEEVIIGGGGFCATSSILAPTRLLLKMPPYYEETPFDFMLQMHLASCGNTYCFVEKMSAYRVFADGSWTSRMKEDSKRYDTHLKKASKILDMFNEYTNFKYDSTIKATHLWEEYKYYFNRKEFRILRQEPFKSCEQRKLLSRKNKLILFFGLYLPSVLKLEETFKRMIRSTRR